MATPTTKIRLLVDDPIDLLLDETTHDIVIADGDFVFSRGLQGLAQAIKIAVEMIRGEWFSDLDEGVPWFERDGVDASEALLGQKFNEGKIVAAIRDAILSIPYEVEIKTIAATFDRTTRTVSMSWDVKTVWGDTLADTLTRGL